MPFLSEELVKIILAIFFGAVLGAEREYHDKPAGLRTMIFICLGACLFMILSLQIGGVTDPARIAAMVVSGVGFLGAGVILREGANIIGINTAATIWLTAALGMIIGSGGYRLAVVTLALTVVVLWFFPRLENWLDLLREERSYVLTMALDTEKFLALDNIFKTSGLAIHSRRRLRSGTDMICTWRTSGPFQAHEKLIQQLFTDPDIKEFHF